MTDPNIELLTLVAEALGDLRERLVFVGGCATALLITDEAAAPVRATEDVDAIIAVVSLPEYRKLDEALRSRGFSQTLAQSDPPFRWTFAGLKLDVMPIDPAVLGFSNRWYEFAMQRLPGTALGTIPVRRLFTTMGTRTEPLTYWFPVGDKAVQGTTQKKACGPALRPDRTYSKWYALSCFFDRPGRGSSTRIAGSIRQPTASSSVFHRTQAPERSWRSLIQAVWSVSDRTLFFQNQLRNH